MNWEDYLDHLVVFQRIINAILTVNPAMCNFTRSEVSFHGRVLGSGRICPQVDEVEAIRGIPVPILEEGENLSWPRQMVTEVYLQPFQPCTATHWPDRKGQTPKDQVDTGEWSSIPRLPRLCSEPVHQSPYFLLNFFLLNWQMHQIVKPEQCYCRVRVMTWDQCSVFSQKLFPRKTGHTMVEKGALVHGEILLIKTGKMYLLVHFIRYLPYFLDCSWN